MATTTADLEQEIAQQLNALNELRLKGASPAELDEPKKKLGELKRNLALAKGVVGAPKTPAASSSATPATTTAGGEKKRERLLLKTAKGTRDYGPSEMFCREHIERIVKDCFTTFGGSALDTPVFERKDILAGKYGEDAKLIFDLQDQGGEQLALRYDHTVPLARYLAMNGGTGVGQAKLWQVGKVYRRDNPVMSKGRMREFSQADFDITGAWDSMIPDAEIISLICTIMTRLEVGEFAVKINHRKILDGIFEVCGVPQDKIRTISSAVDKLDKLPWVDVKKEMTEEKGLDPAIADKIGEYVKHKGGPELLEKLNTDQLLLGNASAKQGLTDMGLLFTYLRAYNVLDKLSFDLSLARGLDYYTGIIYEVVTEASAPPGFNANANALPTSISTSSTTGSTLAETSTIPPKTSKKPKATNPDTLNEEPEIDESSVGVGSLAAGGRYDGLVSMFSLAASSADEQKKKKPPPPLPCVGVSIGMDRVFALLWPKWAEKGMRSKETMVYVMAASDGLLEERVKLVSELRAEGIKTDFLAKSKPKLQAQFAAGEKDEVPFAIIIGADELKAGLVTVKEQKWELVQGKKDKVKSAEQGTQVKRDELVKWLKETRTYQEWGSGKLVG